MSHGIEDLEARHGCLIPGRRNHCRRGHAPALRVNGHDFGRFLGHGGPIGQRSRLRRFEFRHIRQSCVVRNIAWLSAYHPVPGKLARSWKCRSCCRKTNNKNRNPHAHVLPLRACCRHQQSDLLQGIVQAASWGNGLRSAFGIRPSLDVNFVISPAASARAHCAPHPPLRRPGSQR